ncbi:hypothetical protein, partial [Pseudomonas aeruginosa]
RRQRPRQRGQPGQPRLLKRLAGPAVASVASGKAKA